MTLDSALALIHEPGRVTRDRWNRLRALLDESAPDPLALAEIATAIEGWSGHVRRVTFVEGITAEPWWPLVRGLHFGNANNCETLAGLASHITHLSFHEDASLSAYNLHDLVWVPPMFPGLTYFMLDGPNQVESLAPLAQLPTLEDVLLIGYSSLDGDGLAALNALPELRRLVVWEMAIETIETIDLQQLGRLALLELPFRQLMALPIDQLVELELLCINNASAVELPVIEDQERRWFDAVAGLPSLERLVLHYEGRRDASFVREARQAIEALVDDRVEVEILADFATYNARFFRFEPVNSPSPGEP